MLTIKGIACCRLCAADFDQTEDEWSGGLDIGMVSIPKVGRRFWLPDVCDMCWRRFDQWRQKRLSEERRRATNLICIADPSRSRMTAQYACSEMERIESVYARFSPSILVEWLSDGLGAAARRKAIQVKDEAETRAKSREKQNAWNYSFRKSARRIMARHAPDAPPETAMQHQ